MTQNLSSDASAELPGLAEPVAMDSPSDRNNGLRGKRSKPKPLQLGRTRTLDTPSKLSPFQKASDHSITLSGTPLTRLLRDRPTEVRKQRAPFYPSEFFLGSTLGHYCMLGLMCSILISSGALTWAAIGGTKEMPPEFKSSLWISWGLFFDPGTQMDMNPGCPPHILWTAIIFSVLGYWLMLTNMGLVVEMTRGQLTLWEQEYSAVREVDHILILGWTHETQFFIKQLVHETHECGIRKKTVVVLADADPIQMRRSINDFLPSRGRCCRSSSIPFHFVFRKGCPHDPKELEKVSVATAQDIIVLGEAGPSQESDLRVYRVILALASLPGQLSGRVLAEVRCADTSPILEDFLHSHVEGIHARSTVNRMLCLMACKPVAGDCLANFSSWTAGEQMYCVQVPHLEGYTFREACRFFEQALCIGIKKQSQQVCLGPPDDQVIEASDKLVIIAGNTRCLDGTQSRRREHAITEPSGESKRRCFCRCCCRCCRKRRSRPPTQRGYQTADLSHTAVSFDKTPSIKCNTTAAVGEVMMKTSDAIQDAFIASRLLTGADWDNGTNRLLAGEKQEVQPDVLSIAETSGNLFVIIGWTEDFKEFLQTLDHYVRFGCEVHVITDKPQSEQRVLLERAGLVNITVRHYSGSCISVEALSLLPLEKAHAILILAASGRGKDEDAFASDSSAVACAALICGICEGKYGVELMRKLSGRIICEVLDPCTERMLQKNWRLRKKVKFFRSNALETNLFAMATSEPNVFNILVLLLCPTHEIGKLVSVSITSYLSQEDKQILLHQECLRDSPASGPTMLFSYWQLHQRVRDKGEFLIGWHRSADRFTRLGSDINRNLPVKWSKQDRLLVIRKNTNEPAVLGRKKTVTVQAPQTPSERISMLSLRSAATCRTARTYSLGSPSPAFSDRFSIMSGGTPLSAATPLSTGPSSDRFVSRIDEEGPPDHEPC